MEAGEGRKELICFFVFSRGWGGGGGGIEKGEEEVSVGERRWGMR